MDKIKNTDLYVHSKDEPTYPNLKSEKLPGCTFEKSIELIEEPILILDIETTGLDINKHCILSIGLKVFGKDIKKEILLKPDENREVDAKAMEVNQIDLTYHSLAGTTNLQALAAIEDFIDIFDEKPKVLGRNVHFDINFIDELFQRIYGERFKDKIHHQYYDVRTIANYERLKGNIPYNVKLGVADLHQFFFGKKEIQNKAHGALSDVEMDEENFIGLLKL